MLALFIEAVRSGLRGRGFGFRVQIKPSWSGRVYGTYIVRGAHLALGLLFLSATAGLLGRLVALNLETADCGPEVAGARLAVAHQFAMREVAYPARNRRSELRAERLSADAKLLETVLGVSEADSRRGVGSMGIDTSVNSEPPANTLSVLARRFRTLATTLATREHELRYTPSIVPLSDTEFVTTSPFGRRISPFTQLAEIHRGLDMAADLHSRLVASADGVVVHAEIDPKRSAMGLYAVIDHGGRYQSYYGHCSRLFVVEGQVVRRGELIAELGSTGRSTGPHVHYEVRRDGQSLDPRDFLMLDPRFKQGDETWLD